MLKQESQQKLFNSTYVCIFTLNIHYFNMHKKYLNKMGINISAKSEICFDSWNEVQIRDLVLYFIGTTKKKNS